jgi:Mrp family chromosome partitioning ATPase/capsular polysaccharide biosynthesis protein
MNDQVHRGLREKRRVPFAFVGGSVETNGDERDFVADGPDLRFVLGKILARRRWLALGWLIGALLMLIPASLYVFGRAETYTARADVLISNTSVQLSGTDAVVTQQMVETALIQSQIMLAQSNAVLGRVLRDLSDETVRSALPQPGPLESLPLIADVKRLLAAATGDEKRVPPEGADVEQRQRIALITALRAATRVERAGGSQIVSLSATAATPEAAASLANATARAFLAEIRQSNALVSTSGALRDRIGNLGPTGRGVNDAFAPEHRDGIRAAIIGPGALTAGGFLGIMAAAVFAGFGRRIASQPELERAIGCEVLGEMRAKAVLRTMVDLRNAEPAVVETLRRIRAAALENAHDRPRVLGISSDAGHEKTAVAFCLAKMLAQGAGRVLLVDADLSRREMTRVLGLAGRPGLTDVLMEPSSLGMALAQDMRRNLDVLGAGQSHSDLDAYWRNFNKAIEPRSAWPYDWVVMDLPSLERVVDVRVAAPAIDDLVIVTRAGVADAALLRQQISALGAARSRLIGGLLYWQEGRLWRWRTQPLPSPKRTAAEFKAPVPAAPAMKEHRA